MREHVFVDETKERGFYVAAAAVLPSDVTAARRTMKSLRLPGQRRPHFTKEDKPQRHKILDAIESLEVTAVLYDAGGIKSKKRARDVCLTRLVHDLAHSGAAMLVLDQDDAALQSDRRLLYAEVRSVGARDLLEYRHRHGHEEPLLAIPDAIAWCWARGGEWRARVRSWVEIKKV